MILINTYSTKKFTFNGVAYFKNYVSRVIGNRIEIFNCYEAKDVLMPLTHYNQFSVNGSIAGSATAAQLAIMDVIYSRVFTAGDTTLLDQNNIGKKKQVFTDALFQTPSGNTINQYTTQGVVHYVNNDIFGGFTVTEQQTPVLLYAVKYQQITNQAIQLTPIAKYVWEFLGGKGSWGLNGIPITASQLEFRGVQNLLPDDIDENENQSVTDLGDISESDFLSVINSTERDLSDTGLPYFFKYFIDDLQYVQLFIGTNGVFDGDFVAGDFQMVTDSSQETVSYLQAGNNLSDVTDVVEARTNLEVYSKSETDNKNALKVNKAGDTLTGTLSKMNSGDIFYLYDQFTDAANYSRMKIGYDAPNNRYLMRVESFGTGVLKALNFGTSAANMTLSGTGGFTEFSSGVTTPSMVYAGGLGGSGATTQLQYGSNLKSIITTGRYAGHTHKTEAAASGNSSFTGVSVDIRETSFGSGNKRLLELRTSPDGSVYTTKAYIDNNGNINSVAEVRAAALSVTGLIIPGQFTDGTEPAWQLGAMYFNTTINKMKIGGAAGWEIVTSS